MDEQVRFGIKSDSELPLIIGELNKLISTQEQLGALGEKMSKKQQDAYRTQSLAIRDLTDTIQANYSAAEKASNAQSEFIKKQNKEYEGLGDTVKSVRNQMIAAFGVSEIKELIVKIFELTATWQKYEAALSVGLGSQAKATAALQMLQKYADVTNFTLDELADTFTKFANRGVVLGTENLQRIGDVANALQKPFAQLGEAILDINNTERWTELGIKAKTAGDKVSLSFKGVTLEVDRTEQAVMLAISAFGTLNGVQGQTEKQALTLQGKLSTLQDSAAGLGRTVGNAMTPAFEAAIDAASGLVKVVGGSESAFTRTVNYVKAMVAAWITYELAVNAAAIKTELLAAKMVAKEAITKGLQIAVGTYNLAMQALSGVIDVNYNVTTKAATAARGFWAALAANPIGAVVAIVGTLITSYQLYKAATTEVTTALGEEELKLRVQQKELKIVSDMALSAAAGTDERKRAINRIMKDYPDYFKGIDIEKLSNAELKTILDKVNASYSRRIDLARESYKIEQLTEKQKTLFQQEAELFQVLAEKMPALAAKAGGDIKVLYNEIKKLDEIQFNRLNKSLTSIFDALPIFGKGTFTEQVENVTKGLAEIEGKYKTSADKINKINEDALPVAVKLENARWAKVSATLDQGSEQYTKAYLDHQIRLLKAQGEYISTAAEKGKDGAKKSAAEIQQIELSTMEKTFEVRAKIIENNADVEIEKLNALYKKKKISEEDFNAKVLEINKKKVADLKKLDDEREAQEKLTAAEIQKINLDSMEKTYETRRKIIENSAAIEIQQVNQQLAKEKISREQAAAQIAKIEQKKVSDLLDLKNEENGKIEELTKKLQDAVYLINLKAGKEVIKIDQETVKKIIEGKMEIGDYEEIISKKRLEIEKELAEKVKDINKETARIVKATSEEELRASQQMLETLVSSYSQAGGALLSSWNNYKNSVKASKEATNEVNIAQGQYNALVYSGTASVTELANAQKDLANAQEKQSKTGIQAAQSSLGLAMTIFDTMKGIAMAITDSIIETNNTIIAGYQKVKEIITDFYTEIIENGEAAFKTELENFKGTYEERSRIIEAHYAQQLKYAEARDVINFETAKAQKILEIDNNIKASLTSSDSAMMGKMVAGMLQMQAFEEQSRIDKLKREIDNAEQIKNAKLQALQEEFDKFKEIKEEQIRIENEALATILKANEQFYSDKQIRLENDDVYRRELLVAGEAREIKALVDARDREVQRAEESKASAEEITRIKNAFNASIAEVHAKYQTAMGDKEKEVSLANIESKAQETDSKNKLEEASKTKIDGYKDEIQAKETQTKNAMASENEKYQNFVIQANRAIFESQKAMKIAELRAEIAILRGKRNLFNRGKIDSAIDDLNSAIGDIQGLSFDTPTVGYGSGSSNPNPEPVTGGGGDPGAGSNPSNPEPSNPNPEEPKFEQYFKGTPYVNGLGYPDGIDTVPAMLTKGERVVPVSLNEQLGSMVSNEDLINSHLILNKLKEKFPEVRIPEFGLLNYDAGNRLGNVTDLAGLEREVKRLVDVIESKPEVKVIVDAHKVTIEQIGQNHQHVDYYINTYSNY